MIRYDAVFEMYKFCEQRGLRARCGDTCGQHGIAPTSTSFGHDPASPISLGVGVLRWRSRISGAT
jgi:hypothetical protein